MRGRPLLVLLGTLCALGLGGFPASVAVCFWLGGRGGGGGGGGRPHLCPKVSSC